MILHCKHLAGHDVYFREWFVIAQSMGLSVCDWKLRWLGSENVDGREQSPSGMELNLD